jgi:hypothetical protein
MRPNILLLAVIVALLSGDTAPERPPSVMLAAVPVAAPVPEDPSVTPDAADPCAPSEPKVLLSTAPIIEPRWHGQDNGADPTATFIPTCAQLTGTPSPRANR